LVEIKKLENALKSSILRAMNALEIIAELHLGKAILDSHPHLSASLRQIEQSIQKAPAGEEEKERIDSIVQLCLTYTRETSDTERNNILRTLEEICENAPLELPKETIEEWEASLALQHPTFKEAKSRLEQRRQEFRAKYFSLRASAGLATQEAVAQKSGLRRSYVAVIETGMHLPQQKTLQKLARAFGVDVAKLRT
jgi:DNA-binding XRE family transcriptional regulator